MKPARLKTYLGASVTLLLVASTPALAQTGRITGLVTQEETSQPLEGAAVSLAGTNLGALTRTDGRYLILNVPPGSHTLRVELIGHATVERAITVSAGQMTTANAVLAIQAIALREVVVTGVAAGTQKVNVPFTIEQLRAVDLPVPQLDAATALQGKVPGVTVFRGSGRPGEAPSILLRAPKSIDASGRSQDPLIIVDGVILGASMVDIDALDIETIEVVKGAAASSLYGSRAEAGVIQITTKRGRSIVTDGVQYTVRSELGKTELPGRFDLLSVHPYKLTADGSKFVSSSTGAACAWLEFGVKSQCVNPVLAGHIAAAGQTANEWNTFAVETWPGGARDQVATFFNEGDFAQHYIAASGRSGSTNFHVSFNRQEDQGVLRGQQGFRRNNFRVNLDQQIDPNLQVSASAFYSRSKQEPFTESAGNPFFDLTRMPAGVDLTACEDDLSRSCLDNPQKLVLSVDPTNIESPNPIYELLTRKRLQERTRFLGSSNVRYSPRNWLDLEGNVSYDRLNLEERDLFPKGYRTLESDPTLNNGYLELYDELNEALNASLTATLRFDLSENLRNRTQFRYLIERDEQAWNFARGPEFAVGDVPSLGNLNQLKLEADSYDAPIRADGYFAITNFEFRDRYILDALVRNDGSSLFGPDQRRQWYYRLAGAWRISQEPWFTIPGVDEFKLRYSYGTAGGRPRFDAQYETFSVSAGKIVPITLGNRELKPEFSREQDMGFDASLFDARLVLGFTYARTVTDDQILPVPVAAYTGYQSRWQNAGTLESNTFEASLEARLVQREDLTWSARAVFDRTRSEITELSVPAFKYGVAGQNLGEVYFARKGEELGTFYGAVAARGCSDLPKGYDCNQFVMDQYGFLVWVGQGGSLAANKWGTNSGLPAIQGKPIIWGSPVLGGCTDRTTGEPTFLCPVGNSLPDYNLSVSSTLGWKGFTLYGLLDGSRGFAVYNQPLQWGTFRRLTGMFDQTDVPAAERKPLGYFDTWYGLNPSVLHPDNMFVQDGSFWKLREVSLRYRLDADQIGTVPGLAWLEGATISLIGRNLKTWTDYNGYDPETGRAGGDTGSAAIARVDGYSYPNFRTFTLSLELNF